MKYFQIAVLVIFLSITGCFSSKKTPLAPISSISFEALTALNLSEEATKNDEIRMFVFLVEPDGNIQIDDFSSKTFSQIDQPQKPDINIKVSKMPARLMIALVEHDSETEKSMQHYKTLKEVFTKNPDWESTTSALATLSKKFGDDDLMDVQIVEINSSRPELLEFSGAHLFDSFKYTLRLSYR